MKKKLMSVLLAGTIVASLAACGTTGTTGTDTTTSSDNTQTEAPAATETQDTTTTETAATETAPAGDAGSVRLLNGKPEINDQMQALAAKYNEETGNTLIVETIGGDTNASDELKKM